MSRVAVAVVLACSAFVLPACARYGAEQLLLDQFFSASRLRDRTAIQHVATVMFEPLQHGTVSEFTILDVVELESSPAGAPAKQVTLLAPVRLPEGGTATKLIILILQWRDRLIVTGFTIL